VSTDQFKQHLEFFGELGVDGVRLDPDWHAPTRARQPMRLRLITKP
jgi:hypothetical protein